MKWILKDENVLPEDIKKMDEELEAGYLLASVLVGREIKDSSEGKNYLATSNLFEDAYLLPDLKKALDRVKLAREKNEKTVVFGDYDADGITASAIMKKALEAYGIDAKVHIPDRFSEGYGMNKDAVKKLSEEGFSLIITVDCAISCVEEISYASSLGMDVIVTDHHNCPDVLPSCVALINPKRKDSLYPTSVLSGAGVAYKFAMALLGEDINDELIQLAAIGTIADVVDLTGENRGIVSKGIKAINEKPLPGIEALLMSASKSENIDVTSIAFLVSPRINCAGRMESPFLSYELLMERDREKAFLKADRLNKLNNERRAIEQKIYDEAVKTIKDEKYFEDEIIVVGGKNWHQGVVGIVAAKIAEAVHKPCILISYDSEGIGKGSGRSIEGFDIYSAIKSTENTLIKFGGHTMAAGIALEEKNEDAFRKAINSYACSFMTEDIKVRKLYIDARVHPSDITLKNLEKLSLLEPCGAGNSKPVFACLSTKIDYLKILSEGKHLKLRVQKDGVFLEAVGFGMGKTAEKLKNGMTAHIAGNLEINDYTGRPQMILKDILYKEE